MNHLVGDIFAHNRPDDIEGPDYALGQRFMAEGCPDPPDKNRATEGKMPSWREMCEEFPEDMDDFTDEEEESSQEESEAGTLSEELHGCLAAAAASAAQPAIELENVCREYTSKGGSSSDATSPTAQLFQSAVNKLRPVTPLMAAAAAGKEDSLEWLLARGAKADIRCSYLPHVSLDILKF